MTDYSKERLENRIRDIIGGIIVSGGIKNRNLSTLASVTGVKLSSDNKSAKVYVSAMTDKATDSSVRALNSASGYIQSRIAAQIKTKNTPVLTFVCDDSIKEGERINNLIDSLIKDEK